MTDYLIPLKAAHEVLLQEMRHPTAPSQPGRAERLANLMFAINEEVFIEQSRRYIGEVTNGRV